jgi:DNA-binding transcriptional MerR regulator
MSDSARALMMPEAGTVRAAGKRARPKKAPSAFRTISEVADALHIPQHVLRFWETKFQQVKPLKRGGGRRYYRPEDIGLLRRISDLLYIQGYTIKGVQRLLRESGGKLSDDIPPPVPEEQVTAEPEIAPSGAPSSAPSPTTRRASAASMAREPELPMPGLVPPLAASSGTSPGTPPGRAAAPRSGKAETPGKAEAEVERLRGLLRETLAELEALRQLLR